MSGYVYSSDYRLNREDYPYFTEDEFNTFRVKGKKLNVERLHLKYKEHFETRIAKYSLDHDEGRILEMDLNIVICGKTGSGKSSTANTILGRKAFRASISPTLVTKVSLDNTCTYRNRRITVVDTPGIHDTDIDNATIRKELARIAFLLKDGVHCFIICMNASEIRFDSDLKELLELIKQDGQGNFFDYCMLTYTKVETELETCTLGQFLEQKKEQQVFRRFLENIKDRVVAVNNKCLVPAEEIRNRGALIKMVDVVVATNRQNENLAVFTNDLFKKAGLLQEKLTPVVQRNNFHQVLVNAAIEVVINNTNLRLPYDAFLKGVISVLKKREQSEEINPIPDLFNMGTGRVRAKYVNQIRKIYNKIQTELDKFIETIGYNPLAAAAVLAAVLVGGGRRGGALVRASAIGILSILFEW